MKKACAILLPLMAACATKSEIRNLPSDAGTKGVYKESYDKVRLAAQDSTAELGFKVNPKDQSLGSETEYWYIGSQGLSSGSRYVRVRLSKGPETTVFIAVRSKAESREAMQTDDLIEKDLHKRIASRLAAAK
jgi:hypothetical protein